MLFFYSYPLQKEYRNICHNYPTNKKRSHSVNSSQIVIILKEALVQSLNHIFRRDGVTEDSSGLEMTGIVIDFHMHERRGASSIKTPNSPAL